MSNDTNYTTSEQNSSLLETSLSSNGAIRVWVLKVIILVGLFVATYIFALLPVKLVSIARATKKSAKRKLIDRCVSFLSCFAAGVFLATCLLDLYPEVEEKIEEMMDEYVAKDNIYRGYPVAESVMIIGFFMVFGVEQAVLAYKESHMGVPQVESPNANGQQSRLKLQVEYTTKTQKVETDIESPASSQSSEIESTSRRYDQSMHQDLNLDSPVRTFIVIAALSIHSVFEGLSVGLQESQAGVLSIFGALILHKCIIAFSIGLNLAQSKLSFLGLLKSNAVFCMSSPIGIAIGIVVIQFTEESVSNAASGILQGLACGTFLYVTFFEVLPHEFNKPTDRGLKFLFVIIGIIVVSGVVFLEITYEVEND